MKMTMVPERYLRSSRSVVNESREPIKPFDILKQIFSLRVPVLCPHQRLDS